MCGKSRAAAATPLKNLSGDDTLAQFHRPTQQAHALTARDGNHRKTRGKRSRKRESRVCVCSHSAGRGETDWLRRYPPRKGSIELSFSKGKDVERKEKDLRKKVRRKKKMQRMTEQVECTIARQKMEISYNVSFYGGKIYIFLFRLTLKQRDKKP